MKKTINLIPSKVVWLIIGIGLITYALITLDWGAPRYKPYTLTTYTWYEVAANLIIEFFVTKILFWLPGAYCILFYFPKSRAKNIIKWGLISFVIFIVLVFFWLNS